jgi:holo-[acyl-carrier protein] synthase
MERAQIINAVAKLIRRRADEIDPTQSLASIGVTASFGLSALRSQIEAHTGQKLPVFDTNMTIERLINLSAGAQLEPSTPEPDKGPVAQKFNFSDIFVAGNGIIGVGLDMQEIAPFPQAVDFRTDAFYRAHFSPREIATALLRPDARAHFCGLFCAKEAVKKSHPLLLNLRMEEISISHEPDGRPSLSLADPRLDSQFRFMISITHTDHYGMAICLTSGAPR